MDNHARISIYEKGGSKEGLVPKFERHRSTSKQGEAYFDNLPMLSFSRSILLMSMRTRDIMRNTDFGKGV
jgi:hypothetical protein